MASEADPTARFSDRVADYVRYRPGYPREIVAVLANACGLSPASVIADIGCGPGNLARIFLENGNRVIGVEPNGPMREAAVHELAGARFTAIDGRAEETGLETGSIDFVTAGQAFHWFDPGPARAEFLRILRPGGWCVLVWNERHRRSAFLDEYEQLLIRYGNDYAEIRDKRNSAMEVERFFAPHSVDRREFTYTQQFDFAGLSGRLFSSSYAPKPGDAGYEPILRGLRDVFDRFSRNGLVAFDYETFLYYGRLA